MTDKEPSKLKRTMNSILGIEPEPPVGAHPIPRDASDRRQFIAFVLSISFITLLAIAVVQFDLFSFEFRDIPPEEQLPGREVITPTSTVTS